MNKIKHITFLVLSMFFIQTHAQDTIKTKNDYTQFNPIDEDIEQYLPPLQTLIDSAVSNSPFLKYRNSAIIIAELNTKSTRREWSQYLGVISDVKYGLFDNLILNQNESGDISSGLVNTTQQTRYSAGIYLKFPLKQIINRRNLIKIAQEERNMAMHEYNTAKQDLRKLVIKQYNDLILAQRLMRVKNSFVQDVVIQKQMAEQEFKNNEISVSEMTRLNSMYSKARTELETAKADFNNAYLLLQEIVGYKFKLKTVSDK